MGQKKLPIKPSKLIPLAVKDIVAVERSKNFKIEMETWAKQIEDGGEHYCTLCMGGAVLMKSMCEDKEEFFSIFSGVGNSIEFEDIKMARGDYDACLISSLDSLREYSIFGFLYSLKEANRIDKNFKYIEKMNLDFFPDKIANELPLKFKEVEYEDDPELFKKNMRTIAKTFEKLGY